jgi:hypothetical protein
MPERSSHATPRESELWREAAPWLVAIAAAFALYSRLLAVGGGPALWPFTDAFEYASMAHWMARGEGAVLRIGPAFFPARVPPTLSVLLLPQAWLDGDPRRFWIPVFACGVAALFGCFRLARALGLGRGAALAASALLATSPGFASYARYVMGDVPAVAAWLALCGAALVVARSRGDAPRALALGALAAGVLVALRVSNAAWVAGLALATAAPAWRGIAARPRALAVAGFLGAAPLAALAAHNARVYGSPLRTGYDYWLDESRFFSWEHAFGASQNVAFYLGQIAGVRSAFFGNAFGDVSDLHALPVALLGAAGVAYLARARRFDAAARRVAAGALVGLAGALLFYARFSWHEGRYLLPWAPIAAIGCAALLEAAGAHIGPRAGARLGAAVAVAAATMVALPPPLPGPLVEAVSHALPRLAAARHAPGERATRLPLALAALFVPRDTVLVPNCAAAPLGRDVQLELVRRDQLLPLRVDPGSEALWEEIARGDRFRCTRRSPSNARGTARG